MVRLWNHDCPLSELVATQQKRIEQLLGRAETQDREIAQLKKALIGASDPIHFPRVLSSWSLPCPRLYPESGHSYVGKTPSLTGRPVAFAPSAASVTCGQVRNPEPNAPPTKGDTTRTFCAGMPNTAAISSATL